jgi:hypothetical protein
MGTPGGSEFVRSTRTRPDDVPTARLRRHRASRRVFISIMALFVVLGLTNRFGLRLASATVERDGVTFRVEYASVTRSGLATPWQVEVRSPGGFEGPVTIATSAAYLDRFDFNQWYPEPSGTATRGDLLLLTFERPEGGLLRIRFDGRASPTFGLWSSATTSLETAGLPPLSVAYRTWVMP